MTNKDFPYKKRSEVKFPTDHYRIHNIAGFSAIYFTCLHLLEGTVVLLDGENIPWVFCANCGWPIASLKEYETFPSELKKHYEKPFRTNFQFTLSTADTALRSMWDYKFDSEQVVIEVSNYCDGCDRQFDKSIELWAHQLYCWKYKFHKKFPKLKDWFLSKKQQDDDELEYWCYSDKSKRFPSYRMWKLDYISAMDYSYSYRKYKLWLFWQKIKYFFRKLRRKNDEDYFI